VRGTCIVIIWLPQMPYAVPLKRLHATVSFVFLFQFSSPTLQPTQTNETYDCTMVDCIQMNAGGAQHLLPTQVDFVAGCLWKDRLNVMKGPGNAARHRSGIVTAQEATF